MTTRESLHLVGNFRPDVLDRWKAFAELTDRDIRYTTFAELNNDIAGHPSRIIILDDHGLNELELT